MSLPYQILGPVTGSVQSGSYLNSSDTSLFYASQSADIWFGLSLNDVIEISSFSTDDQTQNSWMVIGENKSTQSITLTYLNNLNVPTEYSYNELINPFIFYKSDSILLQPPIDLNTSGIFNGSNIISYNFTRNMAGNMFSTLTIKNISPSRTEIKLIPSSQADIQYNSFCAKKFPIKDIAPILLSTSNNISYDSIYNIMNGLDEYKSGISFLKFVFFLNNDGSVINFLKNLYEDYIKYSNSNINGNNITPTITRIQGIKTYYNNFLLQNYEQIADFNDIRNIYLEFVNLRLDEIFNQFLNSKDQNYINMRKFCYDYFVSYFYDVQITPLQSNYENKYFGKFKNVLNFGNNRYFSILNNNYIDERISVTDPLTLIIKLSSPLDTDISIKDTCWVSNFGMTPYVFTTIFQNVIQYSTVKISPPNFNSPQNLINIQNTNKLYSADDISYSTYVDDSIKINKNLVKLNIDYSNYSNFIVFSSAQSRINIFKNKVIQLTQMSASLVELNNRYDTSLSSSIIYPYYFNEESTLSSKITEIVDSFDGFESYLYNSGNYTYNVFSRSFSDDVFVSNQDISASLYDQNNRDNLISNIPQYIINDSNNSDYLTFLDMIGHHFDNIYTYISAMPIEKQAKNQLNSSVPTNTLKEMLYSFGWNVDDIISSLDIDEVYLNSMNSSFYGVLSGQERLQTIWNRILVSLPGIYKTKGTLECVNYLMSCYGLPSSMITVREYGGVDYSETSMPTYILDEKTYMLNFSGIGDYIEGPIPYSAKTIEFKFSINPSGSYTDHKFFPLFTSIPYPYSNSNNFNWAVGFYKLPGKYDGQLIFQMGSGSSGTNITSSILPIFNGDIFSVMVRRNEPISLFEPSITYNSIPLEYDLVVQRNENGETIFYSTSSVILYNNDNQIFSQWGQFRLSNGNFIGTIDKLSIWDIPIDNSDFQEHVNDLNSYGYSGSLSYKNLWVRLNWDYPQNMYSSSGNVWIDNQSSYYSIPNYYTDGTLTSVNPSLYSASLDIIDDVWLPYYPTGSVDIIAYNFPKVIDNAFSASWIGAPTCMWVSHSVYPYQFEELTYEQNIDASKYGPNKYKNIKINKLEYNLDTRLDPFNRSTYESEKTTSGESNQLGFFIDPQDSKNKDILRYVGNGGIMNLISNPANLYSDKYYDLKSKNDEYNSSGNKKTYFNELLTVYKFYFDASIFQAIKNILPARANAYTGVVIEPTILERPKYQNKQITSSAEISYQKFSSATIKNNYTLNTNALWANFNMDISSLFTGANSSSLQTSMINSMPPNYQHTFDLRYIGNPNRDWPVNLNNGYYMDYMDDIQQGFYPDFESYPRLWETSSSGPLPSSYTQPIYGSVTHKQRDDGRFLIGTDHGVDYPNKFFSGFNKGNHPVLYYMIKIWNKYYYYSKTGEYSHSLNPSENLYNSASVYLYKYVIVDEHYMRNLIYFTDRVYLPVYDISDKSYYYDGGIGGYLHKVNTFLGTPEQKVNNVVASNLSVFYDPYSFTLNMTSGSQYFELSKGCPRNHYTHKLQQFSKTKYYSYNAGIFIKGHQTMNTTVNSNGINDGSYPVQSSNTSNVNVVNSSTVIQNLPIVGTGQITPNSNQIFN